MKHMERSEEAYRFLMDYIPNDVDKVICEAKINKLKADFPIVYETPKSKEHDSKKDMEEIKNTYVKLKKSVILMDYYKDVKVSDIKTETVPNCVESLIMLDSKIKTKERLIYYNCGKVLDSLKACCNTQKEFADELKKADVSFCRCLSYANKLIKFYKTCLEYTNLRYATLNIRKIVENLTDLKKLMINDESFWTNKRSNNENNNGGNSKPNNGTNNETHSMPNNEALEVETDNQNIEFSSEDPHTELIPEIKNIRTSENEFEVDDQYMSDDYMEGPISEEENHTELTPEINNMQVNEKE